MRRLDRYRPERGSVNLALRAGAGGSPRMSALSRAGGNHFRSHRQKSQKRKTPPKSNSLEHSAIETSHVEFLFEGHGSVNDRSHFQWWPSSGSYAILARASSVNSNSAAR